MAHLVQATLNNAYPGAEGKLKVGELYHYAVVIEHTVLAGGSKLLLSMGPKGTLPVGIVADDEGSYPGFLLSITGREAAPSTGLKAGPEFMERYAKEEAQRDQPKQWRIAETIQDVWKGDVGTIQFPMGQPIDGEVVFVGDTSFVFLDKSDVQWAIEMNASSTGWKDDCLVSLLKKPTRSETGEFFEVKTYPESTLPIPVTAHLPEVVEDFGHWIVALRALAGRTVMSVVLYPAFVEVRFEDDSRAQFGVPSFEDRSIDLNVWKVQVETLGGTVKQQRKEISRLNSEANGFRGEIAGLQRDLKAAQNENSKLAQEKGAKAASDLVQMRLELKAALRARNELSTANDALKASLRDETKDLNNERTEHVETKRRLNGEEQRTDLLLEELKTVRGQLNTEKAKAELAEGRLTEAAASFEEQESALQNQIVELQMQLAEAGPTLVDKVNRSRIANNLTDDLTKLDRQKPKDQIEMDLYGELKQHINEAVRVLSPPPPKKGD